MPHKYFLSLLISLLILSPAQGKTKLIVPVPQKAAFEIVTINVSDVNDCYGSNSGSIEIQVSGGQSPYKYSIDGGSSYTEVAASSFTFTNLTAGVYTVVVQDNYGEQVSAPVSINQPSQIHISSISRTNVTGCYGNANGSISITATNGTPPYTYSIDNGSNYFANGGSFTNLTAGNYTIKVKDSNGCIKTGNTITLSQPVELEINTIGLGHITVCYGELSGFIEIEATGGTIPREYSIDGTNYQSGDYFGGLPAGDYHIKVRDGNGCTVDGGIKTLTQPDELVITSENAFDVNSCYGDNTGRIEIAATGGTGEIQYSIDDGFTGQTSGTFENLYAGEYDVAITDQNNCTVTGSTLTINEPSLLKITGTDTTHVNGCFGDNSGEIIVHASGGTGTIHYSTDNGSNFQTNGTFENLTAGTYQVMIKDDNGCETIGDSYFLTQPTKLIADNASATDVEDCYGDHTGTISMIAYGGTGALEYSVDNGTNYASNYYVTGLPAGTYYAVVRDSKGCTASFPEPLVISQPEEIIINSETPTDPTCYNYSNGQIEIKAQGGNGNYQYSANGGTNFYLENVITGLSAGPSYEIVVMDGNNCEATGGTYVLNNPPELQITEETRENVSSCHGGENGSITVTATGGTGQILYSINGGIDYQTSGIFSGLSAGSYQIMVKDENNCITTGSLIELSQPTQLIENLVKYEHVKGCNGENIAWIEIQASGGTAPLSYSIDGGTNFETNGGLFENLSAGTYNTLVKDAKGCLSSQSTTVVITEPPVLSFEQAESESIQCNEGSDGKIILQAQGGLSPYKYSIDGGTTYSSSNSFSGLTAGSYQTMVKDYHNCTHTGPELTINEPNKLIIQDVSYENIELCNGDKTGSITITATGGVPDLEYSIDNGNTFEANNGLFTNLSAGIYYIDIRDNNECLTQYTQSVELTQPPKLNINEIETIDISCAGETDGEIYISATGGTGTIEYSIDGGGNFYTNNGVFTNLSGGLYPISITDANGCIINESSVQVYEPSELQIDTIVVKDEKCMDSHDGSISIFAVGGVSPYSYSADGGSSFQSQMLISGLAPGDYQPVVIDYNGCRKDAETVSIESPSNSSLFTAGPLEGCSPLDVNFTKTANGDTYRWVFGDGSTSGASNPTHTFVNKNLGPVDYTVWTYALSENGCRDSSSTSVKVFPQPRLIFSTQTDTLYFPDSEIIIDNQSPSGYSNYLWDFGDGHTSATENPRAHTFDDCGRYTISVGAVNQWCTDTTRAEISVMAHEPEPIFEPDTTESCYPATINLTSTAEHSVSYVWDFGNGETSEEQNPSVTYEEAGTYRITLSADGYCDTHAETDTFVYIYDSPQIDFSVQPDSVMPPNQPIHCYNYSSGYELQYFWDFGDGSTSTEHSPIHYYQIPGEYLVQLTVISGHKCVDSLARSETVFVFPYGHIEFPNAFTPDGNGENDYFKPAAYDGIAEYQLLIYNRWGQVIYETDNPDYGWNGKYKGRPAVQDVYAWRVSGKYRNGTPFEKAGNVTLVR
jgi:gliding motility-associated-like protein